MARIEIRTGAIREVLKSSPVNAELDRRARRIAAAAGAGYEAVDSTGKNRERSAVIASSYKARVDNARNNTLLRALGAGRG